MNNFTPRAQQVLALARKEADRFNHNFVGTEHLLLGLIKLGQGVAGGGLMEFGPDSLRMARRAAFYVDKIANGADPATLPVEEPSQFELVVNLKTAKALGLTIPQSMLQRADEVIE